MKEVFGIESDTLIIGRMIDELAEGVKKQKEVVENGYLLVRKKILLGISALYGDATEDVSSIGAMFYTWASELDEAQRDILNPLQSDESKPIVKMIGSDGQFSESLLITVPMDMRFGAEKKWTSVVESRIKLSLT